MAIALQLVINLVLWSFATQLIKQFHRHTKSKQTNLLPLPLFDLFYPPWLQFFSKMSLSSPLFFVFFSKFSLTWFDSYYPTQLSPSHSLPICNSLIPDWLHKVLLPSPSVFPLPIPLPHFLSLPLSVINCSLIPIKSGLFS